MLLLQSSLAAPPIYLQQLLLAAHRALGCS